MTTKYKIVGGFLVMLLLLMGSGFIGYKGLRDASQTFTAFNDLARLNVLLSEINTANYAQTYMLDRFLQRQGPEYMQKAVEHMRAAENLAKRGIQRTHTEEMRNSMEQLHADTLAYVALLEDMQQNALEWMDVYENQIEPSMKVLYDTMSGMSASEYSDGLAAAPINGLWQHTSQVGLQVRTLAASSSPETLRSAASPMKNCRQIAGELDLASFSPEQRTHHANYMTTLASLEEILEANSAKAIKVAADIQKTYAFDDKVSNASLAMTAAVDERMLDQAAIISDSNAKSVRNTMLISGAGFILAILLAAFIIYSLISVLKKSAAYASVIAEGNFDYEPQIREKGEIGGLIAALREIPRTLKKITGQYDSLETNIEQGYLLSHGDATEFKGEFADLIQGTDHIIERFRTVLEHIPSPVVMLNKDLKATYLNAVARELAGETYQGKTCFELFAREDFGTERDGLDRAMRTKKAATGETTAHPGGRDMDISYTAIPMLDANNEVVAVMQLITDLTSLKTQQRTMERVTQEATQIADRVASTSAQLAAKVEKVSADTDLQRERVEVAASAMTEMNAAVLEVARGAGEAAQQSDESRSNAESGAALVNDMVASINDVNEVAVRLQQNMEKLDSQVVNIGKVMDVITDIADQTNLLALNAAIEAAHAGDAGRGFAVVADEVRKLAEKTMQATEEVAASVESIQHSSRASMAEVTATVEKVGIVTEMAHNSGSALNEIVELSAATSGHVVSIATAAEEQSASSEEITQSLEELSTLVIITSEEMTESSSAVQELAATAQDLRRVLEGV